MLSSPSDCFLYFTLWKGLRAFARSPCVVWGEPLRPLDRSAAAAAVVVAAAEAIAVAAEQDEDQNEDPAAVVVIIHSATSYEDVGTCPEAAPRRPQFIVCALRKGVPRGGKT